MWQLRPGFIAGRSSNAPPPGPVFSTPADLTGLIGWWDASISGSYSLTGSDINTWADQSGGGHTMAWTGFGKPTYSATGFNTTHPATMFDAVHVGSAMSTSSFPMGTGNTLTFWYVGNLDSANANSNARVLSYVGSGGDDFSTPSGWGVLRPGASTTQMTILRDSSHVASTNSACTANANHRVIGVINSSGVQTLYVDGASFTESTAPGNFSNNGTLDLGRGGGFYWAGPVAECGVATGDNTTFVAALDSYLQTKWGL